MPPGEKSTCMLRSAGHALSPGALGLARGCGWDQFASWVEVDDAYRIDGHVPANLPQERVVGGKTVVFATGATGDCLCVAPQLAHPGRTDTFLERPTATERLSPREQKQGHDRQLKAGVS